LINVFDSLRNKYKSIEKLTQGTKEWNEAIMATNAEVMDLIGKYPELAGLVTNKGGLLKIDLDSSEA
jgi:hypothetical protein